MAKFIQFEHETPSQARVTFVHYAPEQLSTAMLSTGAMVDAIPESEMIDKKSPVLYYDPQTGRIWYEYLDRPLTPEERQAELEQQVAALQQENLMSLEAIATLYEMLVGGVA